MEKKQLPSICILLTILTLSTNVTSLNQEGLYLYQFKLTLDDPDSTLSSWNVRDTTPCNWFGVRCDSTNTTVTELNLSNTNIQGPFTASILCRLPNLSSINLFNNSINQTFPLQISLCQNLLHLDLSQNLLTGSLPETLPLLPKLIYLDLTGNNFSGPIPLSFGSFKSLEILSLVSNLLEGTIPPSLGNITSLKMLNLSYNPFYPGRIPPEIGNLTNLEVLWLTQCNLVGVIPETLGKLKKLKDLDLALNDLYGSTPSSLTELTSLRQIELYNNSLSGELPKGMGNLSSLRLLDASMNHLTGRIPTELCSLSLESLNLYENLYELRLFGNRLTGRLPENLGKRSPLRWLDVSSNQFWGNIPASLCDFGELEEVLMIYNMELLHMFFPIFFLMVH